MQAETLMSRVLDKLDILDTKVTAVSDRTVRVEDAIKRQDDYAIPEMQKAISELQQNKKIIDDLCKVVSRSDGRMNTMEADIIINSKANKMIEEITTGWKAGKWIISIVVSVLLFIVAIKNIISGGIVDGLKAIKNLL